MTDPKMVGYYFAAICFMVLQNQSTGTYTEILSIWKLESGGWGKQHQKI